MKGNKYIFLMSLLLPLLLLIDYHLYGDDLTEEWGKMRIKGQVFFFQKNDSSLTITDQNNHAVCQVHLNQENTHLLHFGYCDNKNSFYHFQSTWPLDTDQPYSLRLTFTNNKESYTFFSVTPFYSPVLIGARQFYICYITEEFTLVVRALADGKRYRTIPFSTPIMNCQSTGDGISFSKFCRGKYRTCRMSLSALLSPAVSEQSEYEQVDRGREEKPVTGTAATANINLNYRKFVGFGDSITYGQIGGEYHPELGYIPRLHHLINEQLYEAEVINEGEGNRRTAEAAEIFESVVLQHQGKFLLFHLGTNDAVFLNIPLDSILFNIKYMINIALRYDVCLVLSTLIPRNTIHIQPQKWQRALQICQYIREQAVELHIPLVDFWQIFFNYPEEQGGYMSLMSDHVHPNEDGYQLMAEQWLETLINIPPQTPENVTCKMNNSNQAEIQWTANPEPDLSHYLIQIGFSPQLLFREAITTVNHYTLTYFLLHAPVYTTVYYRIQAVDRDGQTSHPTPILPIKFR